MCSKLRSWNWISSSSLFGVETRGSQFLNHQIRGGLSFLGHHSEVEEAVRKFVKDIEAHWSFPSLRQRNIVIKTRIEVRRDQMQRRLLNCVQILVIINWSEVRRRREQFIQLRHRLLHIIIAFPEPRSSIQTNQQRTLTDEESRQLINHLSSCETISISTSHVSKMLTQYPQVLDDERKNLKQRLD